MKKILSLIVCCISISQMLYGQACTSNNTCATAFTLTQSASCTNTSFLLTSCTDENATADCTAAAPVQKTIWFKFVATATTGTITVVGNSATDIVVAYNTSCSTASLSCTDNTGNGSAETIALTGLTIGTTYYVQVHDYNGNAAAAYGGTICITSPPPPTNDNCANAISMTVNAAGDCTATVTANTTSATNSNVTPTGVCTTNTGTPDDDIWYSFVAPATGMVKLTGTYVSGSTNVYYQVFSGACAASMPSLLCTDTDGGFLLKGLTAGTSYNIRFYTNASGVASTYTLCLQSFTERPFITEWDLSKAGASTTALTFGVQVASTGAATYTWTNVSTGITGSGVLAANATTLTISGLPTDAIIEVKINPTNFQRININYGADKARLIDVSQWGSTDWTSMANAFYGCNNLNITATDVPNLAGVTNMYSMFSGCSVLNGPSNIGTWNTAAVTNMSYMFYYATAFNQPIGAWNVAAVTNMQGMFGAMRDFNQPIGAWNVAAVTNMQGIFANTTAFNQNISAWNTANVTDMSYMFSNTRDFNQPIGAWNTSAVTNMSFMFYRAGAFNQDISTWNTSAVTNMESMFFYTTAFNQDISAWNVAAVTNMVQMFENATAFNQSLAAWGTKFNALVDLGRYLDNCGMDIANYEATLAGFAATTRTGRSLGAAGLKYCNRSARTILTTATPTGKGWTIIGDVLNCTTANFVTRWDLSKAGASTTALTFGVQVASTGAATYTWTNVSTGATGSGTLAANATTLTISGLPANTIIDIQINPTNFQRININNIGDKARLVGISQWGSTAWTSMATAFYGCNNLNITATDVPNLAGVTNMSQMFQSCSLLNGPSNIGTWKTTAVTNMSSMFVSATAFNKDISAWNVGAVTNMSSMFSGAIAFNQDISAWNIAAVINMPSMLSGASAFNQSLAAWGTKFNAAVVLTNCLDNCGMTMANYEATLAGFALTTHTLRSLGAAGLKYCNTSARTILTTATPTGKGWTIIGDVLNCTTANFVTRWDLSKTGASTTALTFGVKVASTGAATYTWNTVPAGTSGSGTLAANATTLTILGLPANATIEVKINPTNFQRINIDYGTNKARLVDVSQWGTTAWTSMANAFYGCDNLNMTATDMPNLAGVTDMSRMFAICRTLNGPSNIGSWNTATVTNMSDMFDSATAFNQNIGSWNTAAVTNMSFMFYGAAVFNQNIGSWNTAAVTNMSSMFYYATVFNQNIGSWNTAAVTNMSSMFVVATAFNQNIGTWNTAAVTNMQAMFALAPAFNQNIGAWNTAAVTNMSVMFRNATAFNQDIGAWNVAAVTNMSLMFSGATAFNQSLAAWGTKFNTTVNLANCLDNCGMSIANYDATLTGFLAGGRTNLSLGAIGLQYCAATEARNTLIATKGWTIGDAGSSCINTIYAGSGTCNTYTLANVNGSTWRDVYGANGLICSINPNGENLGNLTITVDDPNGATTLTNSEKFLGRTINIFSSAYPSGNIPTAYSLKLYYYDTEFDDYKTAISNTTATLQDLNVAWASGGTGCSLQDYATSATSKGVVVKADVSETDFGLAGVGFYLQFNLNHFTVFAPTISGGNPLPVKLLTFAGYKNNSLHRLNWVTTTEQNASHFEVQYSATGNDFSTIGTVRAAGNTNTPQYYTFDNKKPTAGINYYRLKMIDFDGSFEYSNAIIIKEDGTQITITAFPNPSENGIFTLQGKTFNHTNAVVTNVLGQTIPTTIQNNQLNLSTLPAGVYFVRIAGENNTISVVKL